MTQVKIWSGTTELWMSRERAQPDHMPPEVKTFYLKLKYIFTGSIHRCNFRSHSCRRKTPEGHEYKSYSQFLKCWTSCRVLSYWWQRSCGMLSVVSGWQLRGRWIPDQGPDHGHLFTGLQPQPPPHGSGAGLLCTGLQSQPSSVQGPILPLTRPICLKFGEPNEHPTTRQSWITDTWSGNWHYFKLLWPFWSENF